MSSDRFVIYRGTGGEVRIDAYWFKEPDRYVVWIGDVDGRYVLNEDVIDEADSREELQEKYPEYSL